MHCAAVTSAACRLDWYADEGLRAPTLPPFEMDVAPVTVGEFRQFVDATRYRTDAENAGFAYALDSGVLKAVRRRLMAQWGQQAAGVR